MVKISILINHITTETASSSKSQQFDLLAVRLSGELPTTLIKNVGMFAYPVPSPITHRDDTIDPSTGKVTESVDYLIAYLQALHPDQSETSQYHLFVMDRDGQNPKDLFPQGNKSGLTPQNVAWSPSRLREQGNYGIVLVYNGNIWIIDTGTGEAQQITGDGLSTRVDWR